MLDGMRKKSVIFDNIVIKYTGLFPCSPSVGVCFYHPLLNIQNECAVYSGGSLLEQDLVSQLSPSCAFTVVSGGDINKPL